MRTSARSLPRSSHQRDGLGILELRLVAVGLRRVRRVVERVLDRQILGAKVRRHDAQREAAARAVRTAGRAWVCPRRIEREHRAVAALADQREVRPVDRQLLAVAAVLDEEIAAPDAVRPASAVKRGAERAKGRRASTLSPSVPRKPASTIAAYSPPPPERDGAAGIGTNFPSQSSRRCVRRRAGDAARLRRAREVRRSRAARDRDVRRAHFDRAGSSNTTLSQVMPARATRRSRRE